MLEQSLLIKELRMIQQHLEQLEAEICQIVEQSREGQILMSIPGIGPLSAATFIATIGNIANFSRASELKSYLGWAPTRDQSGTSFDRSSLTSGGSRSTKQTLYLIVWHAIKQKDSEFALLYERLVPLKCIYNDATRRYTGKGKVIGRIAGQMVAHTQFMWSRKALHMVEERHLRFHSYYPIENYFHVIICFILAVCRSVSR